MTRQLVAFQRKLAAGDTRLGWKVAFGSPQALETLGLEAPLVGFLTEGSRLESGSTYPLTGTVKFAVEPEVAVHMGKDLRAGATRARAKEAIAGLGLAFELADLDLPLTELEEVVATNIFQRSVILGPADTRRAGGNTEGLVVDVHRLGHPSETVSNPEASVGNLVDIVRHVADMLTSAGESLRAGDIVITGSVTSLLWVVPGDSVRLKAAGLGELEVAFT